VLLFCAEKYMFFAIYYGFFFEKSYNVKRKKIYRGNKNETGERT